MRGPNGWIGYGPGDESDEVIKVNHRLIFAYPKASNAIAHGVVEGRVYTEQTAAAVRDLTKFINTDASTAAMRDRLKGQGVKFPLRDDGVATLDVRKAIGAYVPAPVGPKPLRYPLQGVFADSRAFLNPPDAHSFQRATDDFAAEGFKLYSGMVGTPIIVSGYSMGGVSVKKFLDRLPAEWRQFVKAVLTFGDPAMPADGSLLGDDPGEGISRAAQPQWVRDRYYSFSIDGDWYPRARGLLFLLYQVISRAELTLDFAVYLFTVFPLQAFQELVGTAPSSDPLAGILGPLAGLITTGPDNAIGKVLNPTAILTVLPTLVNLLFDAVKFIASNAHFKYDDPSQANWDGMTAVNKAAQIIRDRVPEGATYFSFPGTWANWDQGFQFDAWARLPQA